jgi:predicted PilT family ATPase
LTSTGANIRKIVADAGGPEDGSAARMVKFPRPESDDTTIRLEGNGAVVERIAAAIEEFVRQKEDQVTVTIEVPPSQHRFLIGRGGETRRNLESQFNIILDVPKQGSGRTDVKITGPSCVIGDAKAHILSMVKEQQGETVQVPRNLHHVIAENGSFFRRLRNDLQVTVDHAGQQTPPRPGPEDTRGGVNYGPTLLPLITDEPSTSSDSHSWRIVDTSVPDTSDPSSTTIIPWVLSGTSENVAKAKVMLEKAVAAASQQSATGYLILPDPKTYRFVIGPGGSQINAIRKRTGCRINVPKDQARGEAIEIKGSKDNLEIAKDMILEAVRAGASANGGGRT